MGLGKTIQVIDALKKINAGKVLIICPAVAKINWHRHLSREHPNLARNFKVLVNLKDELTIFESGICSFEYATKNYKKLYQSLVPFDCIVVDESHFLKSPKTKRAKAIIGIEGLIHYCQRMWFLSGTPAPNNVSELWTMFWVLGVVKKGYDAFIKEFCHTRETSFNLQILGTKTEKIEEIKQMLNKIMLRRTKKGVKLELPPITYENIYVEPGKVDLALTTHLFEWVFPTDRRKELKATLAREANLVSELYKKAPPEQPKLQMANTLEAVAGSVSTLRKYTGQQKVEPVIDLLNFELEQGLYDKIVVFAVHRDVVVGLRDGLPKWKPTTLYGGTPPEMRQFKIDRFIQDKTRRIFVANIQSAGISIDLTVASQVLFIEQDWTPGNNLQALMRCHRIGQDEPVTVRFVNINGSLDTRISATIRRKMIDLEKIFD